MTRATDVVWVVPDKLGGSLAIVQALRRAAPRGAGPGWLILTDNVRDGDARATAVGDARMARVRVDLPAENLFAALRRLRRAIPRGGGVLVASDWLELAMEHAYPTGRAVVQILHGDHPYYYDLARRHAPVIDRFVAYSTAMYDRLRSALPHRADAIVHLPYGVPLPARRRLPAPGPLRLVFAGRIEHGQKGVFDLPLIDAVLDRLGVAVQWTVIGDGPDLPALQQRWAPDRPVRFLGALAPADVLDQLPAFDVFVLPSRAEGYPVALVEAMGAGLVPVVSDLASGVSELVRANVTGLPVPVGHIEAAAAAIAGLAADRARLEALSAAACAAVGTGFDPDQRAHAYYELFASISSRPPHRRPGRVPYGSRLDRWWLPNPLVRAIRRWRRP